MKFGRARRALSKTQALVLILLLVLGLIAVAASSTSPSNTTSSLTTSQTTTATRTVWYCGESSLQSSNHIVNASEAPYDDQIFFNFGGNYTSLAFNVTAVQYTDNYGYGPGYLLNAESDKYYWYQIGISFNWPNGNAPYPGFQFLYEEWNSSNLPVPFSKTGEQIRFTAGGIHAGNLILLKINFTNNQIETLAKDWNTNQSELITYPSLNATRFIPTHVVNSSTWEPTSVLAEWYHVDPYQCARPYNAFLSQTTDISNSSICIDEWNFTGLATREWFTSNAPIVYSSCSPYIVETSGSFRNYTYAVANASSNGDEFIS